jgi:predicted regulator of Ras-like GTPase activity (Roadblock/LC7/MglB family)
MAMQGRLGDMSVADLIQHTCQDGKTAKLQMENLGQTAQIFFDGGQVVHATLGELSGEAAVYQALTWIDGSFNLEVDVAPPARSISRSYAALLLEGARRIDEDAEPPPAAEPAADIPVQAEKAAPGPLSSLAQIEGVGGAVLVAEDGVVIGHSIEGDPEKEGAVAAFIGAAALQAGASLGLGEFKRAAIGISTGSILVLRHEDTYVALLLKEGASPAMVAGRAEAILAGGG